MKIAFDVQVLLKGRKTGIGWCTENILIELENTKNISKQLNCFTFGYKSRQKEEVYKYRKKGYQIKNCSWFHDVPYRIIWNFIPIPYSIFFGKKADVTVFFNYVVPVGTSGKTVVLVHDMAYRAYPETVRKKTKYFLDISLEKSCKRADKIITISNFSKKEILKYFPISEDKVEVVPLGVDFKRFHIEYTKDECKVIQEKYGIKKKYLLYLGTIEPRKNLERLIRAYALLLKHEKEAPDLVLAGGKGWLYEEIFQTVEKLKLKDHIHFLGYILNEDVPILLRGAEIFVFPSLYEGFGLPPLEAMACGTPVVTSNTSSLSEVTGNAAILVNPLKIESIYEGIYILLKDQEKRKEMVRRGLIQVKKYTWKKTSEQLLKICRELTK